MLHDLQFAFRQLLKSPGFSLVAILTLALAIGANTAIFSAIDAVLLHPLPYPDPDRLVIVQETLPRYALHGIAPTAPDYAEFRRQATCFGQVAAVRRNDRFPSLQWRPGQWRSRDRRPSAKSK